MIFKVYPWQESLRAQWLQLGSQRHHAMLCYGKAGIGKLLFARAMAASLLCRQPVDGHACGQCDSCHWLSEGTHPDFREISPEEAESGDDNKKKVRKRQQIVIDQIRALHDYLSLSNHQAGGMRVVLIQPLEAMNLAASNALLKLLEEPPQRTQFLLVSHQRQALLPTILSRCMQVEMPAPSLDQGLQWLETQAVAQPAWYWHYSGGAPTSIQPEDSPLDWHAWYVQWRAQLAHGHGMDVALAGPLLIKPGMEQAIQALQKWLLDLWLSSHQLPLRYHVGDEAMLRKLSAKLDMSRLLTFQQQLNRFKMTAQHPLNQELQLEQLLLQYKSCFND